MHHLDADFVTQCYSASDAHSSLILDGCTKFTPKRKTTPAGIPLVPFTLLVVLISES